MRRVPPATAANDTALCLAWVLVFPVRAAWGLRAAVQCGASCGRPSEAPTLACRRSGPLGRPPRRCDSHRIGEWCRGPVSFSPTWDTDHPYRCPRPILRNVYRRRRSKASRNSPQCEPLPSRIPARCVRCPDDSRRASHAAAHRHFLIRLRRKALKRFPLERIPRQASSRVAVPLRMCLSPDV